MDDTFTNLQARNRKFEISNFRHGLAGGSDFLLLLARDQPTRFRTYIALPLRLVIYT